MAIRETGPSRSTASCAIFWAIPEGKKHPGTNKCVHSCALMDVGGLTEWEISEIFIWPEDYVAAMVRQYIKKDELLPDRIRRLTRPERERPL